MKRAALFFFLLFAVLSCISSCFAQRVIHYPETLLPNNSVIHASKQNGYEWEIAIIGGFSIFYSYTGPCILMHKRRETKRRKRREKEVKNTKGLEQGKIIGHINHLYIIDIFCHFLMHSEIKALLVLLYVLLFSFCFLFLFLFFFSCSSSSLALLVAFPRFFPFSFQYCFYVLFLFIFYSL